MMAYPNTLAAFNKVMRFTLLLVFYGLDCELERHFTLLIVFPHFPDLNSIEQLWVEFERVTKGLNSHSSIRKVLEALFIKHGLSLKNTTQSPSDY